MAANIHPTAIVDARAELGDGVTIGPHAIVEPDVVIGADCHIAAGAIIRRHTALGADNRADAYCVLGGAPQDLKFDPGRETFLRIGDHNVFREYVTVSRATTPGGATLIGSRCFFMAGSHVGHDSVVGDRVILTNSVALAGHVEVGSGAVLSAGAGVHQFCWIGELVIASGHAIATQHVPPFVILRDTNRVVGLNVVGLRRAESITDEDRRQIKEAFRLLYRSSLTPARALVEMDARDDWRPPAGRFREFVRRALSAEAPYDRGLASPRGARRR